MRRLLVPWLITLRNGLSLVIKRWLKVRHVRNTRVADRLIIRDILGLGTLQYEEMKKPLAASFHELLNYRSSRKIVSSKKLPEWELNNKAFAQEFTRALGVRTPKSYQVAVPAVDIKLRNSTVIKPYQGAGSVGVYLYKDEKSIIDVSAGGRTISKTKLQKRLRSHPRDKWIVEELIQDKGGAAATDLKFYCFYGEVFLALEKDDAGRFCFWDVQNKSVLDAGVYPKEKLFEGHDIEWSAVDIARQVSLEIPAPFVRIDFLVTKEEVVFGEFTPRPGSFDKFNGRLDKQMGVEFTKAEDRLFNDLLSGKTFDTYKNTLKQVK